MAAVPRHLFVLACALGIAVRFALVATTFGTNDAVFWSRWAEVVRERGIAGTYTYGPMINHPPPALAMALLAGYLAAALEVAFTDVFRLFQVLGDMLAAWALYRIGRRRDSALAQRLSLFVLLSPAAAFVSGFHCNSDPLMVALVVTAAMLAGDRRPTAAGVTLAMAAGIKIVPIALAPIFAGGLARRARFAAAFAITAALIYLPALIAGGAVVARNLFSYSGGLPYEWGIPGVAFAASHLFPSLADPLLAAMRLYADHGRWAVYAGVIAVVALALRRRAEDPLHHTAMFFLTLFALAPGFGVQYIAWLIPVLPFALPWRGAIAMNVAASVFLFVTYTVWSGGWPWWFGDLARPGPFRFAPAVAGCVMWALVCAALVFQLTRASRPGRAVSSSESSGAPR